MSCHAPHGPLFRTSMLFVHSPPTSLPVPHLHTIVIQEYLEKKSSLSEEFSQPILNPRANRKTNQVYYSSAVTEPKLKTMQGRVKVLLKVSLILLGAFLLDRVSAEDTSEHKHCSYWAAIGECAKNSGTKACFKLLSLHITAA